MSLKDKEQDEQHDSDNPEKDTGGDMTTNKVSRVELYKQKYVKAVLGGSEAKASTAITSALRNNVSPLDIYMKILLVCERMLGEMWMEGKISIAAEHLGTEITLQQMNRLRPLLRPTSRHGHRVVATTVEGDQHYIALKVASDFLYFDGWTVDFLGPSIPAPDIVSFLRDKQTSLLLISATLPQHLSRVAVLCDKVRELGSRAPKIMVGGGAFRSREQAVEEIGADEFAPDPLTAMDLAKQICRVEESKPSLEEVLQGLGVKIRDKRKTLGISQAELGKRSGLDRAYISGVENGKQNVTIGAIIKIATALDVAFDQLLSLPGLAHLQNTPEPEMEEMLV